MRYKLFKILFIFGILFGISFSGNCEEQSGWCYTQSTFQCFYMLESIEVDEGIFFETVKPRKNNTNLSDKYSIFNGKELESCWKNRKKLPKESQRDKFLNLFEVKYRDELYFTHLGQASKREFNVDPLCNLWIKSVKNYINR